MNNTHYDIAIVGGGVLGLALAYHAAHAKLKVAIFERNSRAIGASIRNFGMIWPIGQAPNNLDRALRSRSHWLKAAEMANFWAAPSGSLHLAYHVDEMAVLTSFAQQSQQFGYSTSLLSATQTVEHSTVVRTEGLLGALHSTTEVNIDPRQAIIQLHRYLREQLGVDIHYQQTIKSIQYPFLSNGQNSWSADRIMVASGDDFETLYPELLAAAPLQRCKLQMMRTKQQAKNWKLGPNLAAGLTLQHYASFAHCDGLAELKKRLAEEMPLYKQFGIHVMLSQTALGELTIGDSHEYGHTPSPFNRQDINRLILDYLHTFAQIPDFEIAEYWHGTYGKLMNGGTELILQPEPGVTIVNGVGGAGMTLSFGLAEEVIAEKISLTEL